MFSKCLLSYVTCNILVLIINVYEMPFSPIKFQKCVTCDTFVVKACSRNVYKKWQLQHVMYIQYIELSKSLLEGLISTNGQFHQSEIMQRSLHLRS